MRAGGEACNPAAVSEQVSLNADRVSRERTHYPTGRLGTQPRMHTIDYPYNDPLLRKQACFYGFL